jgi:hypothetical protein
MKLISEALQDVQFMTEEVAGLKQYYISGIFMQANQKNRNGRVYPSDILEREVKRYSDTYITSNRAFGELGHPDGPTINLDRVSHMIKELYKDGDNFIGKAKIMDTPMGKIVKNLMDEGATLGVSSRGMGSLKQSQGVNVVQSDFYLSTAADIVADPSAPDAFVDGIMEGKEWIWDNGVLKESAIGEYKKQIALATSIQLEEVKIRLFSDFIQKL